MSLLPPNTTKQERDIELSVSRLGSVPVPIDTLWNPNTCPIALLPWLAWALSVDYWNANWSEAQKRETIKQSVEVHKRKGTRGAVERALAALGSRALIVEPHEDDELDPYTFNVTVEVENVPVTEALKDEALNTVMRTKNVRSHLADFKVAAKVSGDLFIGSVAIGGAAVNVFPYFGGEEEVSGQLYYGAATVNYTTVSIYPQGA